uniref:Reverse transcriptase domain-containing protein n=1 Tax=uncultured prokaryote TaxID=198431 RepID=A0A0H5Q747_9ZZZZ|nr:hypothetical protein [uncultured prokaryote]
MSRKQNKVSNSHNKSWSNYRQVSYIKTSVVRQIGVEELKRINKRIFVLMKRSEGFFKEEKARMLVVKQANGYFRGQKVISQADQRALKATGGKYREVTFLKDKATRKMLRKVAKLIDIPHADQVGFTRKRSIWDAAARLGDAKSIVNIDLENAFNAIPEQAVYLILRRVFDLNKKHARQLTNAITDGGYLYQGSPLAPLIFNLWTRPIMDSVRGAGFDIVAYADDLTIGSDYGAISHKMVRVFIKWIRQFNMNVNMAKVKFYNIKKAYKETVGLKSIRSGGGILTTPVKFRKGLRKLRYLTHLYTVNGVTHTRRVNKEGEPNELGFVILGSWIWLSEAERRGVARVDTALYKKLKKSVPAIIEDWKIKRRSYNVDHQSCFTTDSIPHIPQDTRGKWKVIYTSHQGRLREGVYRKRLSARVRRPFR